MKNKSQDITMGFMAYHDKIREKVGEKHLLLTFRCLSVDISLLL